MRRSYPRDLDPSDVDAYDEMMDDYEADEAALARAEAADDAAEIEWRLANPEPAHVLFTREWGMDSSATAPDNVPVGDSGHDFPDTLEWPEAPRGYTPATDLDEDLPF